MARVMLLVGLERKLLGTQGYRGGVAPIVATGFRKKKVWAMIRFGAAQPNFPLRSLHVVKFWNGAKS